MLAQSNKSILPLLHIQLQMPILKLNNHNMQLLEQKLKELRTQTPSFTPRYSTFLQISLSKYSQVLAKAYQLPF